jgi:hypothetical protein
MPTVSIVVPFSGQTEDLANDLYAAVQGVHQVIVVDNATPPATASILAEMTEHLYGVYIRNETNLGFAAGNNQGYAKATGDIVLFLNSDIAAPPGWLNALMADVKDGALYGPSVQSQLVAGRHLPYIEGWCIAATRKTWEALIMAWNCEYRMGYGEDAYPYEVWDQEAYPGPYWEDNDLCLRALQADIALVQTGWPVQHKGGRTAGPIMAHGASFAANERTFTERVLKALPEFAPTPTWHRYMQQVYTQSDIQHHLGLLYSLARGNVLELGTRSGVSTTALLAGVEAHGGRVVSVDIDPNSAKVAEGHPHWEFIQSDSRNPELPLRVGTVDTLLIDSEHTYEQTTAELELWAPHMKPGGTILLHDPETFPGVRRAVTDFCKARGWSATFVLPCNGMAVVEVPEK